MLPNFPVPSNAYGNKPKRQKKMMTLQEKIKLLDMLGEGKNYAKVGYHYGVNESTIRYIKKNEAAIRNTVAVSFCESAKRVTTVRNKNIVKMESALALWINECTKKNIPLDSKTIRNQALILYQHFLTVDKAESTEELQSGSLTALESEGFKASKGWFDRFQKRFRIKCVSLHGETADVNRPLCAKYSQTFMQLTEKEYEPEQVHNIDETGLFCQMPSPKMFITKDETRAPGFKAQKDRGSDAVEVEGYDIFVKEEPLIDDVDVVNGVQCDPIHISNQMPGESEETAADDDECDRQNTLYFNESETSNHPADDDHDAARHPAATNPEEAPLNKMSPLIRTIKNESSSCEEDEFDVFARSIAAQMRQLPIHLAIELQAELQNLIVQKRLLFLQNQQPTSSAPLLYGGAEEPAVFIHDADGGVPVQATARRHMADTFVEDVARQRQN